jgi:hypothetical protein
MTLVGLKRLFVRVTSARALALTYLVAAVVMGAAIVIGAVQHSGFAPIDMAYAGLAGGGATWGFLSLKGKIKA